MCMHSQTLLGWRQGIHIEHFDLLSIPSISGRREAMAAITPIHRACWPDMPMVKVYAERVDCDAMFNQLWIARSPSGMPIAFAHAIAEDLVLAGQPVRIMRSLGATRPESRNKKIGLERYGMVPLIRVTFDALLRGRLPLLFATWATPATYRMFLRMMPRVIPAPGIAPDPRMLQLRDAILEHYGLERVPGLPHASVGPRLAMTEHERRHWLEHRAPEVRYFVEQCPNFGQGEYLAGIVPLDWKHFWRAPLQLPLGFLRQELQRRRGRAIARG